jgi:hypothetical protein
MSVGFACPCWRALFRRGFGKNRARGRGRAGVMAFFGKQMSTEPGQVRTRSSSPEAERMRLYRKRRRDGMRYVRIPLHVTEVDVLIRIGRLKEDSRTDAEVLQATVLKADGVGDVARLHWTLTVRGGRHFRS